MNCNTNALIQATVAQQGVSFASEMTAFSFSPDSAIIAWTDSSGNHSGNLAFFKSVANPPTVTSINLNNEGLTSITGLESFQLLNTLYLNNNSLTTVDISRNLALSHIEVIINPLPTAIVNNILIAMASGGLLNGNCQLDEMTPPAAPSGAGITAGQTLLARGWQLATDLAPPAAPVATAATGVGLHQFTANWNAVAGASSYNLFVALDLAFTNPVPGWNGTNVGNVLFQTISGLDGATTYHYRVSATGPLGLSGTTSNIIDVTTAGA